MESRLRPARRIRLLLVQSALLLSVLFTAHLVRRQSLLLPETAAAPRRTPEPERVIDPTPVGPTPTPGPAVPVPKGPPATLIDDRRFMYAENFYAAEVQKFLDAHPGPLKEFRTWVADRGHSFAEILVSQPSLYSLNPQVVLALIEQQSGLITTADGSAMRMVLVLN